MGRAARAKVKKKGKRVRKSIPLLKLDLGCGANKRPGYTGVDQHQFVGVDVVTDLRKPWPWKDNSVETVACSHFLEHLTAPERTHFANELYRVLAPGGTCELITPHWCAARAYGDPTHQWPPVAEFWFYYLKPEWRTVNAPHTDISVDKRGFTCNFDVTWGYALRQDLLLKAQEVQQDAMANWKEACQDMIANLKAVK